MEKLVDLSKKNPFSSPFNKHHSGNTPSERRLVCANAIPSETLYHDCVLQLN